MAAPLFPDPELAEKMRAKGHDVETVADVLGDTRRGGVPRFRPAVLPGTPELPAPGIYFGMSDEAYHALPALSNSGIKKLSASPMIFWASTPWLSERKRAEVEEAADEKAHHIFGKAYHCRIMEGREEFARRFAVDLDPADYPDCLVSTDQIKAAIGRFEAEQPVKPCSSRKDDLQGQLRTLLETGTPVPSEAEILELLDGKVDYLKEAIRKFTETVPVKPVQKVPDLLDGEEYMRSAVKSDWIEQLLALDPEAAVFAKLQQQHAAANAGKTFLSADQHAELEIAAAMVERDPEGKHAFKGGHAEVVLIWYCAKTGVPMKAKVDYLKFAEMVDLKSIANQRDLSIENAIRFAIASYKYNLQPVVYFEGAEAVRKLIRESGGGCIYQCDAPEGLVDGRFVSWGIDWAKQKEPDRWTWIFQQKGVAPITRGVHFPRGGVTDEATLYMVDRAKKLFLQFSEVFGLEPWLDVKPFYQIDDEEIPRSATEI